MNKPAKPRPDFPLFAHANGQWAKKIRGRLHYFGLWDNPAAAEALYNQQADKLQAGCKPRTAAASAAGLTVKELVNAFLVAKRRRVDGGEMTMRTWTDYQQTGQRIVDAFARERVVSDLAADDFEEYREAIGRKWGPVALANEIQRVRTIFKYAYEAGLIPIPMRFGPEFKRPSMKVMRKERAKKGIRMFAAEDLRTVLGAATRSMKAMILLGVNCGFGNADCATLPLAAVNLKAGWLEYARPKTEISRRCHLWPETVQAIEEYLACRPKPTNAEDAGLLFITKRGFSWDKSGNGDNHANPISFEMVKLLRKLDMYRPGLGFSALRHTFRTVADEVRDQRAIDYVMGHKDERVIANTYVEQVKDERLAAVASHVHQWLFGTPQADEPTHEPEADDMQAGASEPESDEPRILKLRLA